jgi:hypothetical protein
MEEALAVISDGKEYTLDELKDLWFTARIPVAAIWPAIVNRGFLARKVGYDADGSYRVTYSKVVKK